MIMLSLLWDCWSFTRLLLIYLYLKTATNLNKYLIENFWDNENGGFYFTKINDEIAGFRKKDIYDGAIPSGNSIALLNLIKLSRITADNRP